MEDEYHVHPYRHGAADHNQLAGGIDFVDLAKYLKQQVEELRAENERLRGALESEPLKSVMELANHHHCAGTWQYQPESYWLAGLAEEVLELTAALAGKHEHSPDVELRQIASIALNWLNRRRIQGA